MKLFTLAFVAGSLLSALCLANPVGFSNSSPLKILDTRKEANGCIGHLHSCDNYAPLLCCSGKCIYSSDVHGYVCAMLPEENEEVSEASISPHELADSAFEAREDESANKCIRDYYSCAPGEPQLCCSGKCVYYLFEYVCSTSRFPDDEAKTVDDAAPLSLPGPPAMSETRSHPSTTMSSASGTGRPWPSPDHPHPPDNMTIPSTATAPNQQPTNTNLFEFAPRNENIPENGCNQQVCKEDEPK